MTHNYFNITNYLGQDETHRKSIGLLGNRGVENER